MNDCCLCQLLLGDKLGRPTIVSEIEESEFLVLNEMIAEFSIANGHLLTSGYTKDEGSCPSSFVLRESSESDTDFTSLAMLLREASAKARETGKLSEDAISHFYLSDLDDDVNAAVLQNPAPRMCCLAYRREIQKSVNTSKADEVPVDSSKSENAQTMWEKVEKYLGDTNTRGYLVKLEEEESYSRYLEKLCSHFVSDVKELILQNVAKSPLPEISMSVGDYIRLEALHHARLCARKTAFVHPRTEILNKLKIFLRDSKCSNQPFIIYGQIGCGKSTVMANIAQSCKDWFSGDCVTVIRFLGTSADSCNIHDTVLSITLQICLAYGLNIPDIVESFGTLHKALTTFRTTVEIISKEHAFTRPLVILLDGIDHLRPYNECLAALWAVKNLPPNVHIVLSSVGEYGDTNFLGALVTLVTNLESVTEVRSIPDEELPAFIKGYITSCRRKLSSKQEEDLREAVKTAANNNPLYLISLLCDSSTPRAHQRLEMPTSVAGFLNALLDRLENEFGGMVVKYFVSYLTVSHVGILNEEMFCLLSSNREVEENFRDVDSSSQNQVFAFPFAVLTLLRHRLNAFIEPRLVYGRSGFGWSERHFRNIVAERYNIIVEGTSEDRLLENMTEFTLSLHEDFVRIYLKYEESTGLVNDESLPFSSKVLENPVPHTVLYDSLLRSYRLVYHLKVLLPVKGLGLIKQYLLFDYNWLQVRLSCVFSFSIFRDVLDIYNLGRLLVGESVIDESVEEISIIFEFLQQSIKCISKDVTILAVEIIGRLSNLAANHPKIAQLIAQAEAKLKTASRKALAPLTQLWASPGSAIRYSFAGPSHFLGYLQEGETGVFFSKKHGIDIWRLQTGELLHRFGTNPQQSLDGILPGHSAEFIILTYYSHINRVMEFNVWSTETGLLLLSSNFQREFEAVALSEDDQLMAVVTTVQIDQEQTMERCILGIAVTTKDIVFRLVLGEMHKDGVSKLMFVRNVKKESDSLISFGMSLSPDLGFWDLEKNCLDFSLQLNCAAKVVRLNSEHKMLVCACSESGQILVINLARGVVDQRIESDDYIGLTDIETFGETMFVATAKNGIFVLSLSKNDAIRMVSADTFGQSAPVRLLPAERGRELLFVGCDTGVISIFDCKITDGLVTVLRGHQKKVNSLSLTKEGQLLSSSDDGFSLLWNFQTFVSEWESRENRSEKEVDQKVTGDEVIRGAKSDISCVLVLSDESQVITGSKSGLIAIWDIMSGNCLKSFNSDFGIDHLYLTPNEQLLIGHCAVPDIPTARILQVWNVETGRILPLEETNGLILIYCSAVTPPGDRLITIRPCKEDGEIGIVLGIYNLKEMKNLTDLVCNIYGSMDAQNLRIIGFSSIAPREKVVHVDKSSRTTKSSKTASKENTKTSSTKGYYLLLDYFPKPGVSFFFTFAICGENMDEISMDSHNPVPIDTLRPECSVVCPNEICITGSTDGKLVSWNIRSQKTVGQFVDLSSKKRGSKMLSSASTGPCAHEASITCLELDWKNGVVISGSKDFRIKLWNISSRKLIGTFVGHQGDIICVHSCMQNSLFVSASADETLCVWRVGKSPEKICTFLPHRKVKTVHLTSNKQRIVALLEADARSQPQLAILRSIKF